VPRPPQTLAQRWLRAVYAAKLTTAERDTACAYACFITAAGVIRVSQVVIAEMTGRHPRDIRRHLAVMQQAGLISLIESAGRGRIAAYRIAIP
jgi:hypothetical protein